VGGRPYGLAGAPGHPRGAALCALGLAAHHLPTRAGRLLAPLGARDAAGQRPRLGHAAAVLALADQLAAARREGGAGSVAVLDGQPGRTGSLRWRRFLRAIGGGRYVVPPSAATTGLTAARLFGPAWAASGPDLAHARTVLSFGAPLSDGFGAPGTVARWLAQRGREVLVQVEARLSPTAQRAALWLPARPGSEAALALALGHVLVRERLVPTDGAGLPTDRAAFERLVAEVPPARAAAATGLAVEAIERLARRLAGEGPAVVLAGVDPGGGPLPADDERAVLALNALLGAVGRTGGLIARAALPAPEGLADDALAPVQALTDLPDGSLRLLLALPQASGVALPAALVARKLAPGGRLVALSAFETGVARRADLLLPATLPLETWDDTPGSPEAAVATFALAAPLLRRPGGPIDSDALLSWLARAARVADAVPAAETARAARLAALHELGRGRVVRPADGDEVALSDLDDADALQEALAAGGCWVDDPPPPTPPAAPTLLGADPEAAPRLLALADGRPAAPGGLTVAPFGWRGTAGGVALPPILAKLDRESGLREGAGEALLHPATGAALGLADGAAATLRTEAGEAPVRVRFTPTALPGVVQVALGAERDAYGDAGADPSEVLAVLCTTSDCAWRSTAATLQREA
jgi:anaerobic selenocysteine-containing dehydrogenase